MEDARLSFNFTLYTVYFDHLCGLVVRVQFLALPDFLKSSGSGSGSTQPRESN
jgi:hypothetical protein